MYDKDKELNDAMNKLIQKLTELKIKDKLKRDKIKEDIQRDKDIYDR